MASISFVMLFSGTTAYAQSDNRSESVEIQMIKNIYEALIYGNCDEAQHHYDTWKIYAGTYDMNIENLIANCIESYSAIRNEKTAIIPGTHVVIARKALANQISWEDAKNICSNLYLNGSNSWRLPTKSELYAIYATEVLSVKTQAKAKHVYMWGEKEGKEDAPRYPTLDLKTGSVKYASKVSTIGCFCVTDDSDVVKMAE